MGPAGRRPERGWGHLALAAVNPDAWIAGPHNLDRFEETGGSTGRMSRTWRPTWCPALDGRSDDVVECALIGQTAIDDDWLEWNLGRHRAAEDIDAALASRGAGEPVCLSTD